jgi:hypothetical protein
MSKSLIHPSQKKPTAISNAVSGAPPIYLTEDIPLGAKPGAELEASSHHIPTILAKDAEMEAASLFFATRAAA